MRAAQTDKNGDRFRRQRVLTVLIALTVLFTSLWLASGMGSGAAPTLAPSTRTCLILDPGHGGIDGGAIAYNGVKESDLNLAIALKLRDLADFYGISTALTRQDDSRRTDLLSYSEHEDLVWRAEQINAVDAGFCLSIHQNTFPTSQPSGAQVLYGAGEESRRLGACIQNCIVTYLQPDNRRLAEPASKGLYLPSHVDCPFALVECGFLSNLTDLQDLSRDNYQKSFAAVLLCACLQYMDGEA